MSAAIVAPSPRCSFIDAHRSGESPLRHSVLLEEKANVPRVERCSEINGHPIWYSHWIGVKYNTALGLLYRLADSVPAGVNDHLFFPRRRASPFFLSAART